MKDNIIVGLTIIAVAAALATAVTFGLNKSELNECQKWQQQAGAIQGFFITQWQKDQCDHYQIEINAPVQ